MKDKQKIMILAALGVVLIGASAFSFMGGGSPEPAPVTKKKAEPKAETTSETTVDPSTTTSTGTGETGTPVRPSDPGKSTGEENPTGGTIVNNTGTGVNETLDPNNPTRNPNTAPIVEKAEVSMLVDPALVAASALPARDPFNGARWDPMEAVKPAANNTPPVTNPNPSRPKYTGPRIGKGGTLQPYRFDPGTLQGSGQDPLPNVGTNPNTGMPDIQQVPYKLNGVVSGSNSAAIVTDGSGKQRLVRVGSQLDPDTKLLGVENGEMVVRHRGKIKKISIEDSAKSTPTKGGGQSQQNQ